MTRPTIKTDEKKQHFDDIYIADTPVPFKERIMDALDYVSDEFNMAAFDRLVLPHLHTDDAPVNFVDLGACFGNTTLATLYGMGYDAIRANWADPKSCMKIQGDRRFPARTVGIDVSANAMAYGEQSGLFDEVIVTDLNSPAPEEKAAVLNALRQADVLISTAALVYLDLDAIGAMLDAFCDNDREGYALVNFLNPFGLDKADATKKLLLKHLEFVGSMATRHRKLSKLERENYPDEEWALLEIWVLKRGNEK